MKQYNTSQSSIFALTLIMAIFLACLSPHHAKANGFSKDKQLKVLTWNIYSLPFVINTSNRMERAKGVVEVLNKSDYDIIVLQETFHKKSFNIIEKGLKEHFPHHLKVERDSRLFKYHHGIFMVSKYPMDLLGTISFKNCKCVDCMSKKGAILVELEKEGQTFQVLGTHLQSGPKNNRWKVRKKQRQQITAFLKSHLKPNVPQLLCGDFNTDFNNEIRREDLINDLEITNVEIPYERTWPHAYYSTKESEGFVLDYIFLKRNGFRIKSKAYQVLDFMGRKKRMALSDHSAVELLLEW